MPDPVGHTGQGCRQCARIIASRLRQIGPSATLATHFAGDIIDQVTGFDAIGAVLCDAGNETDLVVLNAGQDQRCKIGRAHV